MNEGTGSHCRRFYCFTLYSLRYILGMQCLCQICILAS